MYRSQLKTVNDYPLDEVVSALQKSIRRSKEEDAMYWALELSESGYGQYLWRRLMIIAAEDIGIANPGIIGTVVSGWQATQVCTRTWKEPAGEFLGTVIILMCRSPKCREGDDFTWYVAERRKRGFKLEIPDYALDWHTDRGRRLKRGEQYWLDEACKLEPDATEQIVNDGPRYSANLRELLEASQPFLAWPSDKAEL